MKNVFILRLSFCFDVLLGFLIYFWLLPLLVSLSSLLFQSQPDLECGGPYAWVRWADTTCVILTVWCFH